MAKKKSYDAYVRTQIGDLIDQLELPNLYKHALKDRWLDQMIWADKKAGENRKFYYRLRLITIIGGVILPALVGISVQLGQDSPFFRVWFPPLTFALSQIIAVSVAIEEFCKFGDRWREYRKMAEELKSEGWQYLQSSGPYEYGMNQVPESFQPYGQQATQLDDYSNGLANSSSYFELNNNANRKRTHLENYAQFANRIESIINNDVQSYINNLAQHQAKQDAAAQKILAEAQAVSSNKELIAQLNQNYRDPSAPPQIAPSTQTVQTTGTPVDAVISSEAIAAAVGTLKVEQDTIFKANTQEAQTLPDSQKVSIRKDSTFTVMTYAIADHNHFQVTLNQGLGAENRNSWFVFASHVTIVDGQGQPLTAKAPTAPVTEEVATSAATTTVTVTPAGTTTVTVAPVMATTGEISLPVPYFSQRDNLQQADRTCNTSSCAMVAKYLGAKILGDDDYFQYVIKHGDTTDHGAQTQALTDIGIKSTWCTNLDFDDLDKSLKSGLPIVIGINHRGSLENSTGGHMIVVVGRTKSGDYLVHDPYGDLMTDYSTHNGEKLTYSRHVLTYRWTVEGKQTGWGRLFDNNPIPGATAQAAKPVANSATSVVTVQPSQKPLVTPSNGQPLSGIPQCAIELIKEYEGYDASAYADPIHGWSVPTIGYGTTQYPNGRKVQKGDITTREQAEKYLIMHITSHCTAAMERIPTWGKMNANQRGAIYSFAYNLGAGFYGDPNFQSITKVCDASDQWQNHAWVEAQFVKYCNPGTSAEAGLRRRRIAEAKLFCS